MTIASQKAQSVLDLLQLGELKQSEIARVVGVSREYVHQLSNRRGNLVFKKDLLTELRESKGWSIRQLAKAIGVDPGQVSRWESGTYAPRLKRIKQLATVFKVEAKKFVTEKI